VQDDFEKQVMALGTGPEAQMRAQNQRAADTINQRLTGKPTGPAEIEQAGRNQRAADVTNQRLAGKSDLVQRASPEEMTRLMAPPSSYQNIVESVPRGFKWNPRTMEQRTANGTRPLLTPADMAEGARSPENVARWNDAVDKARQAREVATPKSTADMGVNVTPSIQHYKDLNWTPGDDINANYQFANMPGAAARVKAQQDKIRLQGEAAKVRTQATQGTATAAAPTPALVPAPAPPTPVLREQDEATAEEQAQLAAFNQGREKLTSAPAPAAALGSLFGQQMIKTQSFMRESQIKAIVQDISIPATCLLVLCLDEWGTDMLDWEPETLEQAARMSWNAELPQANRDKIWALITHMTTDAFYSSLEGFIHICNALSGHGVDFEQFDPAEVDEMCWGVTEAFLIAPMEKEDRFTEEIVTYMETRLEYEGFQKVPHMLKKFVQIPAREEELNQTLTLDGIGFKNYWKMQEGRLANIDIWIKERLAALFALLESLPLRYANEQGLKRICERAKSTLGSQQALKQEVMAASR
jgi:hypothetical protein